MRNAERALTAVAALAVLSLSCQGEADLAATGTPRDEVRIDEVRRGLDRAFVVFLAPALTVGELAGRVRPPVTVGSRPSPATMASSAPEVVSVEADGSLVPRRAGRAEIRALGGKSQLEVTVEPAQAVQLVEPPQRARAATPSPRREVSP